MHIREVKLLSTYLPIRSLVLLSSCSMPKSSIFPVGPMMTTPKAPDRESLMSISDRGSEDPLVISEVAARKKPRAVVE